MKKNRKLYKIGQVTQLLGITSRTVRYYDQTGILPHVKRSEGGIRLFDDEDIDVIKRVRRMQHDEGLNLDKIRQRLYGEVKADKTAIVITDSGASIPKELMESLPIQIIPFQIKIGDDVFKEGVDLSLTDFWKRSRKTDQRPTAVAPTEDAFIVAYKAAAAAGYQQIYSIHTSSIFTDVVSNATAAANKVVGEITVNVYDSKSLGSGLGLIVTQIAEAISKNEPVDQVSILVSKQLPMVHLLCMVDSLRDLVLGGFIPNPTPNVSDKGNLLTKLFEFKPVFTLDSKTGELEIIECCKTKESAIEVILTSLDEEIRARGRYVNRIMVVYNYMFGEAINLINQIKTQHPNVPIFLQEDTGLLSVFAGPQTVAVSVA
jgi:DegV family protein with EDD domain